MLLLHVCIITMLVPRAWGQYTSEPLKYPIATTISNYHDINELLKIGDIVAENNPDSAINIFLQSLEASKAANYANGMIVSLESLTRLYDNKGMYNKSLAILQQSIPASSNWQDMISVLPIIYNGIGNIYHTQGNYEKAAAYYYQAILIAEKNATPTNMGMLYNSFVSVLTPLKQYKQALYYLNKAEKVASETRNYRILGAIQFNRSNIYYAQKKWDSALLYAQAALDTGEKYNIVDMQYMALASIGNSYLSKNMAEKALPYLLKAQSLKNDNIARFYQNAVTGTLGEAYYRLHNYKRAEELLLQTLNEAQAFNLGNNIIELHILLAKVYEAMGDYKQSLQHQKAYIQLKDSLQGQNITQNINQLEIKYRTAEKDRDIIQKQLLINKQENFLRKKNIWIGSISAGAILLIILSVSVYRINKHKQNVQSKQIHILEQEQEILKQEQEISQLRAMMDGEEKERSRIGQDLHDGIGGMLTAINMNLTAVQQRHKNIPEMGDLDDIMHMLQDTAGEVRKTAHNLMPDILLKHTLSEALHLYCEQINTGSQLQIDLQLYGDIDHLNKQLTLTIYRIVQEFIQNIIKHADTRQAELQIRQHGRTVSITVEDNGVGFDNQTNSLGTGLQNIQSRVHAMQGYISIESAKGMGTTVYVEFDLDKLENIFSA